jgi:glycosyltransferase involved in cell wall biosynthesis
VRVAFLVNDLHLSGGVGVVVRHAALLRRLHGIAAELVLAQEDKHPRWDHRELEHVPVLTLADASRTQYDVAVATWWQTAGRLAELDARRHALFVQSLEDRFYDADHAAYAFAARDTLDLPVAFVTEARWIAETIRALRPDAACHYVRNGVDKEVFPPLEQIEPRLDGPLRILVEGRPEVWFKGVPEAVAAVGKMREPRTLTVVAPSGTVADADRVVGPVDPAELARLYGDSDVVLKLSRVEGMYGPPLEGFHRGATCVTTPVTGHDEYVVHGWNGLVVDWDDLGGTARALDLLARDRRLLHFLRTNANATARAWPSWPQSSQFMALAMTKIAAAPLPHPAAGAETRRRVRIELFDSQANVAGVAPVTGPKADLLRLLWGNRWTACLLRLYGKAPAWRALKRILRQLLRPRGRSDQ